MSLAQRGWIQTGINLFSGTTTRKGIVALVDQAVVSATNFLTGVIIGRVCAVEQFGLYMLGYSIVLFVLELQASLILPFYIVNRPRFKESELAQYTGSTLIHQIGLSMVVVIALAVAGVLLSLGIGPLGLAPVVGMLLVVIVFIQLKEFARRVCFAGLLMKDALIIDSCVAIVQISGLVLLGQLKVLSANLAYFVVGIACLIPAIGWIVLWRKRLVLGLSDAISILGKAWSFGKWVLAGNITFLLAQQLYPWFLTYFHGTAVTGVFAACLGLIAVVNPIVFSIGNILGPITASAYIEGTGELRRVVVKVAIFLLVIMGLFCIGTYFFGEMFLSFIYGDKYVGNGSVLVVLSLSILAYGVSLPAGFGLWAIGRPDILFKINAGALGGTLTLGLLLVKIQGLIGVAYGLLAINAIASVIRQIVFLRLVPSFQELNNR